MISVLTDQQEITLALCSLTSIDGSASSVLIWSWAPQLAALMSDFREGHGGPDTGGDSFPELPLCKDPSPSLLSAFLSSCLSSLRLFLYRFQAETSKLRTMSTLPPPLMVLNNFFLQ